MSEVLFYQLQQPLEKALPQLLEKTLQRGWKAVIRIGSQERLTALDDVLWTYREDSFLPHGAAKDSTAALQPIFLTLDRERPNGAEVLFLVDNAVSDEIVEANAYQRIVLIFDGNYEDQLGKAREDWKRARGAAREATYWQQNEQGAWNKKA